MCQLIHLKVPFIEHNMLSHMEMRFTELQQKAVMALKIIPSFISESTSGSDNVESYAADLEDYFKDDMPSPTTLKQELQLWHHKWLTFVGEVPDTPTKSLSYASELLFPNVHRLLRLILTLPVTTCECERSVSVLHRLKTYLRSTMGQTRLTGLALLHVHYSTEVVCFMTKFPDSIPAGCLFELVFDH